MLKISEPSANHAVTLKLEGRLIGPWVTELKNTCEQHLAAKRSIDLGFTDVNFADRRGLALLLRLRTQGVRFLDCSPFLEEELRTVRTCVSWSGWKVTPYTIEFGTWNPNSFAARKAGRNAHEPTSDGVSVHHAAGKYFLG